MLFRSFVSLGTSVDVAKAAVLAATAVVAQINQKMPRTFGDGILSSLNTISKVYTSTGTFRVTLIATNGNGCIDSLVKTVSVLAKPTPSFTVNSSVQCVNNGFVFNLISPPIFTKPLALCVPVMLQLYI